MANSYDRILNENIRVPTLLLLRKLTGIRSVRILPKQRKMHRTLEKETDILLHITTENGDPIIGNIEWQVKNDEKMLPRMLLYHAMGYDLYGLPVEGFVIYIGDNEMNMTNTLEHKHLKYSFTLINLKDIDPEEFLASELPEEIILAVLAGRTKGEEKRGVIKKVMHKLHTIYKGDTKELSRRLEQMEVLGNLRNIQQIIIEEENTMALTYDLTTDIRYNQGIESGIEKGIEKGMESTIRTITEKLLFNQQLTMEQIADLIERPLAFVASIKKQARKH